jgi:hypothetical protein
MKYCLKDGNILTEDDEPYSFAPLYYCKKCNNYYCKVDGKIITSYEREGI